MGGREFFTTLSVSEALAGFQPSRRTGEETVLREDALGRVPASPVVSGAELPGFARSTVDGYAVRAADTYGAGDGLPAYLDVIGQVRMGSVSDLALRPGAALQIPTGAAIPDGADAVVMVEHTQATMPGTVEVTRPVAVGDGIVRADEDVAEGAVIAPAGRRVARPGPGPARGCGRHRPGGSGSAAGRDRVHRRRGGRIRTPGISPPGQVRDATASALAALITRAGGEPVVSRHRARRPGALTKTLAEAVAEADLVAGLRRVLGRREGRDHRSGRGARRAEASSATGSRSSPASPPCSPRPPACR